MKNPHILGVNLTHGCTIQGGENAMETLASKIQLPTILNVDPTLLKDEKPLFLSALVDLNQRIKSQLLQSVDGFNLVYGGDHALAIGSIAAHASPDQAVLWIDAHGDCNTDESSISQRIHGMPLAVAQGHGHKDLTRIMSTHIRPENILLVGIRSLDPLEEELMNRWGNRYITMEAIRLNGFEWLNQEVQAFMAAHPLVHCSFDLDSMDPRYISGVNTPVKGGFTPDEILPILNTVFASKHLNALDIVEYNPTYDPKGHTLDLILKITQALYAQKEWTYEPLSMRD